MFIILRDTIETTTKYIYSTLMQNLAKSMHDGVYEITDDLTEYKI